MLESYWKPLEGNQNTKASLYLCGISSSLRTSPIASLMLSTNPTNTYLSIFQLFLVMSQRAAKILLINRLVISWHTRLYIPSFLYSRELTPYLFQVKSNDTRLTDSNVKTYRVTKVMIHPEFTMQPGLRNDIALLKLDTNVDIASICLPPENKIPSFSATCYTVGWGSVDGQGTCTYNSYTSSPTLNLTQFSNSWWHIFICFKWMTTLQLERNYWPYTLPVWKLKGME